METFIAIAIVVVLWGLSTAVIFYLDSLPMRTFTWSMAVATLVMIGCIYGAFRLAGDYSNTGVALSFASGLLAWGWTEMSLYMGFITGPRKVRCAHDCSGPKHFGHAVSANLWHEIVVIALAIIIYLTGNQTALWCFTMLWLMHLSARLNVFLGVRNVSEEFVPDHMDVLKGFLRRRQMNWLFPFSCLALAALTAYLMFLPHSFAAAMATTLAAIGLLEHILLMLPLPIEKMWRWSLSQTTPKPEQPHPPHASSQTVMGTLS